MYRTLGDGAPRISECIAFCPICELPDITSSVIGSGQPLSRAACRRSGRCSTALSGGESACRCSQSRAARGAQHGEARRGERCGTCSASGQFLASLPKRYWSSRLRRAIIHATREPPTSEHVYDIYLRPLGRFRDPVQGTRGAGPKVPGWSSVKQHKIHRTVDQQTHLRKPACKHIQV